MTLDGLKTELEHLTETVQMARELVVTGEEIDLDGLEEEVERMCRAARAYQGQAGQELADLLRMLLADIDGLAADMRDQRDKLRAESDDNSVRQKAVRAYGAAPNSKFGKPRK